jgi:endoglucanase
VNRRQFLHATLGVAACAITRASAQPAAPIPAPTQKLWRGFNLLEKFTARQRVPFREADFALMGEWGFNFVRLPLSYHCWSQPTDWLKMDEECLKQIDEAVKFGQKHRVHVNINFHRAPGYCVNPPEEPADLFSDESALSACAHHWKHFATRYQGIPSTEVSFDLLNEPKDLPEDAYARVVTRLVEEIRAVDPHRFILADGLKWGTVPVHSLVHLGIGQSTRGYQPMRVSHHKAKWIHGSETWSDPSWPLSVSEQETWDRARLHRENIGPWKELEAKGVLVHVGEWGAFHQTPHDVTLRWMRDCLELWKEANWGWALWNFRGPFGILNSARPDVQYEDYCGMKLDRGMLDLLRAH